MKSIVLTNLKINQGIEFLVRNFLFSHDKSCSYLSLQCCARLLLNMMHNSLMRSSLFDDIYDYYLCGHYQTDVVSDLSTGNYLLHAQNFAVVKVDSHMHRDKLSTLRVKFVFLPSGIIPQICITFRFPLLSIKYIE